MDSDAVNTLLSIGGAGGSLTVAVRQQANRSAEEPWYDAEVTAEAAPFAGTLTPVFTLGDLHRWGQSLIGLEGGTGRAVLGGGRAAELTLGAEPQVGGPPGRVVISVDLTPSGDDPYPRLSYLIFDVPASWSQAGALVAELD